MRGGLRNRRVYKDKSGDIEIRVTEPAIQKISLSKIPRFLRALTWFMKSIGSHRADARIRQGELQIQLKGTPFKKATWHPARRIDLAA